VIVIGGNMMINKQSLWFITLFSLILVLSIYYVTMSDSSLSAILEQVNSGNEVSTPVNTEVTESSLLVSLRVQEDEEVLKEMENYQSILLDSTKTSNEKNNAYNSLMTLNQKKAEEEKIEAKLKETYQLESFVKMKKDTISIVIAAKEHNANLANNIIRTVNEMFSENKYITVKFQNA